MLSTKQNRLDPSLLDRQKIDDIVDYLSVNGKPALVDEAGNRIDLPKPVYKQLLRVLQMIQKGRAVIMLPEDETFTTQAAANYLGVSRQHLVDLLEKSEIPFHRVGSHRRVYFKDLLAYDKRRNTHRRATLDKLTEQVLESNLYDSSYTGE